MTAFHIIGINLEHGLGEHPCLACGTDILVAHLRRGFLCTVAHEHPTGECTGGLLVEHIFI